MEINQEFINCFVDEASDSLNRWEVLCFELSKGAHTAHYQELFRIAHNLKGGSHSVGLSQYGDFVHKVEDGITLLRDEKIELGAQHLDLLLYAQKTLSEWTQELKQNPAWMPSDYHEFLERFRAQFFSSKSTENHTATPAPQIVESVDSPKSEARGSTPPSRTSSSETIRVAADKLDELIQVIGELSIHQSIVWHTKGSENQKLFLNSLQLGQKLTKELYDKALGLRMQPLQQVFQRLERNIFDLSRSLDKSVEVSVSGGDVELDKAVIEKILDPLTHIVRNAVDHGLESAVDRQLMEKSPTGHIEITARKDAFGVEILVKDDGRGLRAERIREKAIDQGLIPTDAELSPQEVYNLILQPGFSTAEKVTDVSGRGVGLDVVHKALQELGGNMVIDSSAHRGTSFSITLPTSVSIIEVLLVEVGEQNYAIPVSSIEEVISSDTPISPTETRRIYGGHTLSVRDLETLLERRKSQTSKSQRKNVLVCAHKGAKIGLLTGKIIGQQPVVIRSLNNNIEGSFGILGGTILGNGEPGLILDLKSLLKKIYREQDTQEKVA
jgi:two-component system chemotaxis sensor kinase CheA